MTITLTPSVPLQKSFRSLCNVGRARYTVSFHDGVSKHGDGSPFFDIRIFANARARDAFCRDLVKQNYAAR